MKHHDKQFKLTTKFKCLWKKMFCFCTPKTPQQHPPLKYRWGGGMVSPLKIEKYVMHVICNIKLL